MAYAATITVDADLAQVERKISEMFAKTRNFNLSNNNALSTLAKQAKEFDSALEQAQRRVLTFGTVAATLYGIKTAFDGIISSTIKVEKSVADINVILKASGDRLNNFTTGLFKVANDTGNSFFVAAEAAKEFSRQGLNMEQTLKRTNDALILNRISGLGVDDSIKSITTTINAFTGAMLTSSQVVNKFAAVDASFAVSAADLAQAVQHAGSAAEDAGVSFNDFLGLVTAIQERTGRGGNIIGNSLKSIFARVSDTGSIAQLKELGVNIDKTQGGLDKLKALAKAVELNPEFAAEIRKIPGGIFQINALSAALKDLASQNSTTARASRESANALNEADTRSKELNKTLSSDLNKTLNNLINAASKFGTGAIAPTISKTLGVANSILDFTNKDKAEGSGFSLGQGILKGLSNYLSGPGLATITIIAGRLVAGFISYTVRNLETLLLFNRNLEQQGSIQTKIDSILKSQRVNYGICLSTEEKSVLVEKEKLRILEAQTVFLTRNQALNSTHSQVGSNLAGATLGGLSGGGIRGPFLGSIAYSQQGTGGFSQNISSIIPQTFNKADLRFQTPFTNIAGLGGVGVTKGFQDEVNHYLNKIVESSAKGATEQVKFFSNSIISSAQDFKFGPVSIRKINDAIKAAINQGVETQVRSNPSLGASLGSNFSGVPAGFSLTPNYGASNTSFGPGSGLLLTPSPSTIKYPRFDFGTALNSTGSFGGVNQSQSFGAAYGTIRQAELLQNPNVNRFSFSSPLDPNLRSPYANSPFGASAGFLPNGYNVRPPPVGFDYGKLGLYGSLFGPLAGGIAQSAVGDSTTTQRGIGSLFGAAGNVAGLAGLARVAIGTTRGGYIGAGIAAASEIPTVIDAFTNKLPDLERNFKKVSDQTERTKDSLGQYLKLSNDLADIYSGKLSGGAEAAAKVEQERTNLLIGNKDLSAEQLSKLAEASGSGDFEQLAKVISEIVKVLENTKRKLNAEESLTKLNQEAFSGTPTDASDLLKFKQKYITKFRGERGQFDDAGKELAQPTLQEILNDTNAGDQSFSSIFKNNDAYKTLIGSKNTASIFSQLKDLSASGEFSGANSKLSQLSTGKTADAFAYALQQAIKSLVEFHEQVDEANKKLKDPVQRQKNQFVNTLRDPIPDIEDAQLRRDASGQINLEKLISKNKISEATQTSKSSVEAPFLTELQISQQKFTEAIEKIANSIEEGRATAKNAFNSAVSGGASEAISNFRKDVSKELEIGRHGKTVLQPQFNRLSAGADITATNLLEDNLNPTIPVSQRIQNYREQIKFNESLLSPDAAVPANEGEKRVIEKEITLLEVLIKILQTSNNTLEVTNAKLDLSDKTGRQVATIENNGRGRSLLTARDTGNFGQSDNISNQVYNAQQQLKIGQSINNPDLAGSGALALQKLYQGQQIPVPQNIIDLLNTLGPKNNANISSDGKNLNSEAVKLVDYTQQLQTEFNLFSGIADKEALITNLSKIQKDYQDQIRNNAGKSLEIQKEYVLQVEKQLAAQSKIAFDSGRITGDQYRQQQSKARQAELDSTGKLSANSLTGAFFQGFEYNSNDFFKDMEKNASDAASGIKDSFKGAFKEFADGTKSAGDAFKDFLASIGSKLLDRALDTGLNSILSVVGKVGSSFSGQANGGLIGYSSGGTVIGGSGTKDDVPALLSGGEFVVKKSAAKKYGPNVLNALNSGTAFFDGHDSIVKVGGNSSINAAFANTYLYSKKGTKGEALIDPNLSSFAAEDPNNPQNALRLNREKAVGDYLKIVRDFKKQELRKQQAATLQAGISVVGILAGKYGQVAGQTYNSYKNASNGKDAYITEGGYNPNYISPGSSKDDFNFNQEFAQGGRIFGGESSTDNIPAMLTGGEFVATRRAVNKYGANFFNKLNRGEIKAYAEGGAVGNTNQISAGNSIDFDKIFAKFSDAADSLKKSIETLGGKNGASGITVNNVTNINIDKAGGITSSQSTNTTSTKNDQSKSENDQDVIMSRKFADSLQAAVRKVITDEKRPQGLLDFRR